MSECSEQFANETNPREMREQDERIREEMRERDQHARKAGRQDAELRDAKMSQMIAETEVRIGRLVIMGTGLMLTGLAIAVAVIAVI